jgi:hypothetical protein
MPCPGPKIPSQTVTYPSRPGGAIYREAAAVSSAADRDALSHGYGIAPLAQGLTDLQLSSSDPRFTTAALTAGFAGILHTDYRLCCAFSSKDRQQTVRLEGDYRFEAHFLQRSVMDELSFSAGPMVRIRFPPAVSLRTISSKGGRRRAEIT